MSACSEMARVAEEIATTRTPQGLAEPRELLVELARRVAGIPTGASMWPALLVGGRPLLRGGGFRAQLRDRTASQTRHFAGVARAVTVLGPQRTLWLGQHVRRDRADSPDGLLSSLAVEFATALLDGSLAVSDAGEWIRIHVCAPGHSLG